ncbi:MAG: hypothetical protein ABIR32_04525 [Ilumatobacteraceae bacterium]
MSERFGEPVVVGLAVAYLAGLSLSMTYLSYDVWGAFIVLPPLTLVGVIGVRKMFSADLQPLSKIMVGALVMKFVGAAAKYFVSFGAYGGSTDAQAYHVFASKAAGLVWSGKDDITSVLPSGTGTAFMQRFTSFVYTLSGTSKIGGYLLFGWLAFWGICLFVKGACIAIPGLEQKRYALWCAFGPSIVYWPSSIGKEAVMMLALGAATYGFARVLSRRGFLGPILAAVAGLGLAVGVRPHIAALWIGGLMPALLVSLFRGREEKGLRRGARAADRALLLIVIVVAGAALVVVGNSTLKFLDPSKEDAAKSDASNVTSIFAETSRRTSQAGSAFNPPSVASPLDWPYASLRTLLRPLPIEARGAGSLFSALEITLFIIVCLVGIRRVASLPRLVITNPFMAFAMTTLFFGGVAYASFANQGLLVRQKSLLLPLMFLIPCLPERRTRAERRLERPDQRAANEIPEMASALR